MERDGEPPAPAPAAVARRRAWVWLAAGGACLAVLLGTGLWPIEVPQGERIEQLTSDPSHKLMPLLVDGDSVYYTDGKVRWSASTAGGEILVHVQAGLLGWMRKARVAKLTVSGRFGSLPSVDPLDPKTLYAIGRVSQGEAMR